MWVEFVVGSLPCSERFFSGYSGFPLSSKTNISKFQFDQESGRQRTTMWICYLQIVIYLFLFIYSFFSWSCIPLFGENWCSSALDLKGLRRQTDLMALSTQLIKPKFMVRTIADTTPTFIRNWTFNSGGSTRSSTHPGPKAMLTLYPNPNPNPPNPNPNPPKPNPPNPNPNYTGWLWRDTNFFSLWANRTPNVAT